MCEINECLANAALSLANAAGNTLRRSLLWQWLDHSGGERRGKEERKENWVGGTLHAWDREEWTYTSYDRDVKPPLINLLALLLFASFVAYTLIITRNIYKEVHLCMPVLSVLANRTANRKGWKLSSEGVGGGGGGGGIPCNGRKSFVSSFYLSFFPEISARNTSFWKRRNDVVTLAF